MHKVNTYHKSVLVSQVVEYLNIIPNGVYVDTTFGGGGHTRAILEQESSCKVIAIDWDQKAIDINSLALKEEFGQRLEIIWGSFANITQLLKNIKVKKVNGILADFGTSQYQIKESAGFSFSLDTPLDMRMSPSHFKVTAYDIVNKASYEELVTIFYEYSKELNARKIAKAIVEKRKLKHIATTRQLAELIESLVPRMGRKIHPATKVFQALRIVVNKELDNIKSLLSQSLNLLEDKGRLVCISFHSLEDTIVKHFIKNNSNKLNNLTKHVVIADEEEVNQNLSSRSAKLRAAEFKLNNL